MLSKQAYNYFVGLYQPIMCKLLIEHCKNGNSVESFAAEIDATPEVFPIWMRLDVNFEIAMHVAYWKSFRAIEEKGMRGEIHNKTYELIMRNRFNWKDDTESTLKALSKMSTLQLEEMARRILETDTVKQVDRTEGIIDAKLSDEDDD